MHVLSVVCMSPGTGVSGEGLFVYMLSVSWRGSKGRHVSGVWLHMHGLSFYTSAVYAWPLPEATSTTVIEICTACEQPAVP